MKKLTWKLLGVPVALCVPAAAVAALLELNTFKAGTKISAAEVNENFDAVDAELSNLNAKVAGLAASFAKEGCWSTSHSQGAEVEPTLVKDSALKLTLDRRSLVHATVEGGRVASITGQSDYNLVVRANTEPGVGAVRTAATAGSWSASDARVLEAGTHVYDLTVQTHGGSGVELVYGGCWHLSIVPVGD